MNELKKHRSLDQQVSALMSRGLIVRDVEYAKKVLANVNYYRFSGYLFGFKDSGADLYIDNLAFERVKRIYDFDRRLTRILMYALEDIEETFKTRLSYSLTSAYPDNPLIYLDKRIFRDESKFLSFNAYLNKEIRKNAKLPFVKHHLDKYDGKLPMWVVAELFTMGNLNAMYRNLLSPLKKQIAGTYDTGICQIESWVRNLTFTRNHLAHYMRIYDLDFGRTPQKCDKHHVYRGTSNRIFDQLYVMSFMYSDAGEWNAYIVPEIAGLLYTYADDIHLPCLGFPDDWEEIITVK